MKESKIDHSFKKRFVSKLTTNMFKILAGLATLGFIPRALGVETYGDLGFLTVFFKLGYYPASIINFENF